MFFFSLFCRQYNFDGLDLDWEYPTFRDGGKPEDRNNYAKFVVEMREAFELEAKQTGKDRLLITMAVPASLEYAGKGFDIKTLNQALDFFNLLTYDYHSGKKYKVAGQYGSTGCEVFKQGVQNFPLILTKNIFGCFFH